MTAAAQDALELLEAGRRAIERLFDRYHELVRQAAPAAQRKALAGRLCLELTIQAKLREELFYPAAREALRDDDVIDDAESAQEGLKDQVAELLALRAGDPLLDARVAVLHDHVVRHLRNECDTVFARVRHSALDRRALARSLLVRHDELRHVADALLEDALASTAA